MSNLAMIHFSRHIVHRIFAFGIISFFFVVLYILNPSFLTAIKAESATNSLSGFAWSDNIGWISFDRTATNNPPSTPFNTGSGSIASLDLATGKVTGWARALAGCEDTPGVPVTSCANSSAGAASLGWDGWIKLSDDGNTNWVGKGVSVDLITGKFTGYAWGSEVVGWVDFAPTGGGVSATAFSCTPPLDPGGVCSGTQVCSWSGVCIPPNGACSTNFDCGGGQSCNLNGKCVYSDGLCSTNADCVGGQSCVGGICTVPASSSCGDKICDITETLLTCPQDCKVKVQQF